MVKRRIFLGWMFIFIFIFGTVTIAQEDLNLKRKEKIIKKIEEVAPGTFSQWKKGIKNQLKSTKKIIALTFDACGEKYGSGYDENLIKYLIDQKVPATLFISGSWIDANLEVFKKISQDSLFEIENHGMDHKPCSINGKKAYGIQGTKNATEMFEEIEQNAKKIESIIGVKPKYYRSGTAHYDSACVKMINELGYEGVNFNVISDDASAKSAVQKIVKNILASKNGSIILMHMNQPKWNTLKALKKALPVLKKRGFKFVLLKDYELK